MHDRSPLTRPPNAADWMGWGAWWAFGIAVLGAAVWTRYDGALWHGVAIGLVLLIGAAWSEGEHERLEHQAGEWIVSREPGHTWVKYLSNRIILLCLAGAIAVQLLEEWLPR